MNGVLQILFTIRLRGLIVTKKYRETEREGKNIGPLLVTWPWLKIKVEIETLKTTVKSSLDFSLPFSQVLYVYLLSIPKMPWMNCVQRKKTSARLLFCLFVFLFVGVKCNYFWNHSDMIAPKHLPSWTQKIFWNLSWLIYGGLFKGWNSLTLHGWLQHTEGMKLAAPNPLFAAHSHRGGWWCDVIWPCLFSGVCSAAATSASSPPLHGINHTVEAGGAERALFFQ